jgi:hypothetical protein
MIFMLALFERSYETGTTVQASTSVPVQAEVNTASKAEVREDHKPVLVELVTSDQCAECQSAEQLLTRLDRDQPVQKADIIILSERVDHSNPLAPSGYLSPTDPTRRQEDYQSSQPAPLFIINGVVQDAHVAISEIEHSIQAAPPSLVPLRLISGSSSRRHRKLHSYFTQTRLQDVASLRADLTGVSLANAELLRDCIARSHDANTAFLNHVMSAHDLPKLDCFLRFADGAFVGA